MPLKIFQATRIPSKDFDEALITTMEHLKINQKKIQHFFHFLSEKKLIFFEHSKRPSQSSMLQSDKLLRLNVIGTMGQHPEWKLVQSDSNNSRKNMRNIRKYTHFYEKKHF